MISWIQNALEKKGRVVFIILLAVVIVSFVFVIGETPGCVSGDPAASSQKFYGYSLNAEADPRSQEMVREVIISSIINRGQQPQNEQMLTQEFLSRIALLHLADSARIPEPNQEAFVQYLSSIPFFQGADGQFDPNRVTSFLDMTQLSRQFDEATINRALSNDYRIQQLMNSIAPPGFTIPYEVEQQARRTAASYDLSIARLAQDEVEVTVTPTEEELENFFTQRVEAYRQPETRVLSAVTFSPTNFTQDVGTPSDEEIDLYFSDNRSDYLNPDAEVPAEALPSLEDVKDEVIEDWKMAQASTLARRASEDFVYRLFDQEIGMSSPELDKSVEDFSGTYQPLPPMVGGVPPSETGIPQPAFRDATRLDEIRFYTDPIETDDEVVVIVLKEIIPSQIPDLESVRSEVIADYEAQAEGEAFIARGATLRSELSEAVSGGKSFSEAAKAAGLSVETFEEVGWENIPENLTPATIRRAESLPDQEVSTMITTEEGGLFLFVDSRSAPAVTIESVEYQQAKASLASSTSRLFLSTFVGDLIQSGSAESQP